MKHAALLSVLVLAACAGSPPKPTPPVVVDRAVQVSCLKEIPERPEYKFDGLPPAKTPQEEAEQVRVLWKDRNAAIEYGDRWDAAAAGCMVVSPLPEKPASY